MSSGPASTFDDRTGSFGRSFQDDVTSSIEIALLSLLAEVGYGKLSIDSVAKRAGVGQAAIYRRWRDKQEMVIAVASRIALTSVEIPDTGSLRGDIQQFLISGCASLGHPLAEIIIPDLLAEATRNLAFADSLLGSIHDPKKAAASDLLHRAIGRHELPEDTDLEMALGLLAGPLYVQMVVTKTPTDDGYFDRLTDKIVTARTT
jgi:AcrR family transcriptional regulator